MARIKENSYGEMYCSECRMLVRRLSPYCSFCGKFFSNYEEIICDGAKLDEDKLKEDKE